MPGQQTDQQRQATFAAAGQQPAPQQQAAQPAPTATPAPGSVDLTNSLISQAQKLGIQTPAPLTQIQTPTPATSITSPTTPSLPQPTAPAVQSSYFGSVANDVQNTQAALQSTYDQQSAQIQSQLDTLKSQQQTELDAEQKLSQPFNAQLEQTQEQQLGVNSNFQKNQSLADELNSIVNQANAQLGNGSNRFASASTIQATQSSTISGLTARAGLIQAAMSAYSGQISAAYTQIDRSVAAINADNTDQLNYYTTLLNLNSNDQLTLTDEQKTNVANQIATLQQQATSAQTTADSIKQAMLNPATAQAYAQAGVTLTDTPQDINTKLGNYAYSQELATASNQMAQSGYQPVLPGQTPPPGSQVVTTTDSKGNTQQYYAPPKTQVVSLGNGSSQLINSQTGQVISSYGGGSGGAADTIPVSLPDGTSADVPLNLAAYYGQSSTGTPYVDLSAVSASERNTLAPLAAKNGYTVITNKNEAADMTNIATANADIATIQQTLSGLTSPNPISRAFNNVGINPAATYFQTDPQKAAASTLNDVGLDLYKAMSGVQGFRGNQAVLSQVNENLPSIYDTSDTVTAKLKTLQSLISNRENAIVGSPTAAQPSSQPAAGSTIVQDGMTFQVNADGTATRIK